MPSVGTITADFDARSAKFAAELEKVRTGLFRLQKDVTGINQFLKGTASALISAFSARAIVGFISAAGEAQEKLTETAQKIGVTTTNLKALQLVTRETGGSVESLSKVLLTAQKNLGLAAAGGGNAAKFIAGLGLDIQQLRRLSPDQLFLTYADAIGKLGDRNQQVAAANALFGKSAEEVLNTIRAGRPAFEEAAAAVAKLGLALKPEQVALIDQAGDALGRVRDASQAFGSRIAASVAPFILEFANRMQDAATSADNLQAGIDAFVDAAVTGIQFVVNGVNSLRAAFFALAAAGAKALSFVTFGDVSEAFEASFQANIEAAQRALDGVKSLEQIKAEIARIREAAERSASNAGALTGGAQGSGGVSGFDLFGESASPFVDTSQFDLLKEINQSIFDQEEEFRQRNLVAIDAYVDAVSAKYEQGELDRLSFVGKANEIELQMRAQTVDALGGFLNVLAQKHKAAAVASIILNRALAIRDIIANSAVAYTKTLATVPYPLNIAAAAKVKLLGLAQIALVAGTGALEVGNVLSGSGGGIGGGGLGTPSNPLPVEPKDANSTAPQPAVQVFVNGFISHEVIRDLMEQLEDKFSRGAIIITQNSNQADAIRRGG